MSSRPLRIFVAAVTSLLLEETYPLHNPRAVEPPEGLLDAPPWSSAT